MNSAKSKSTIKFVKQATATKIEWYVAWLFIALFDFQIIARARNYQQSTVVKDDSYTNLPKGTDVEFKCETIACRKLSDKVNRLAVPFKRVNQIQLECKMVVKLTRSDTLHVI